MCFTVVELLNNEFFGSFFGVFVLCFIVMELLDNVGGWGKIFLWVCFGLDLAKVVCYSGKGDFR